MRDLSDNVKFSGSLMSKTRTATENGDAISITGFDSVVAVFDIGDWTEGVFVFGIEETDDDPTVSPATWSAVAAGDMAGTPPTIDADGDSKKIYAVGYLGRKQYLRAVVTEGSSPAVATGMPCSAHFILADAGMRPVA